MNKKLALLSLPLLLLGIVGFAGHFFAGAVGGFSLSTSPAKIVFSDISKSPLLTLNVTSTTGFTGSVTVTEAADHTGLSASCSPASGGTVSLTSPGSALVNCNLTATAAGNYLFTFTATSATALPTTQSISVPVTVEEFPLTVVTPVSFNSGTSTSTSLSVSSNFGFGTRGDFSIAGKPTAVSLTTSTSALSNVTLTSFNGFTGTVALSVTTSSPSVTATLFAPSVNLLGTTARDNVTFHGTTNGAFNVVVTATSGALTHTLSIGVSVGSVLDFTVSAGPVLVTPNENSAGTSTITVSPLNAFTGTVNLASAVSPAGLTCTLTPGSVTLGVAQTSTLSCSGAAGSYTVTVTGTSGAISHSASVVYIVQVTVTITSSLVSPGPLTGLTVSCPTAVAVLANGAGTGVCSLSSSSPNQYTVLVFASRTGFPTENRTLIVSVLGYTMSANPNAFTRQNQGASLTSTITVTSVSSFTGSITFDIVPTTGFTATFLPNPATLPAGGTVTTSMTLRVSLATPGNYTIVVRGNAIVSGGIITSTANVQVQLVGNICLSDPAAFAPTPGTGCPATYLFSGPPPTAPQVSPTQVRVGVFVQGSALMTGVSAILVANNNVLKPASVDITGTILPGASITGECLNDVLVSGTTCPPQDVIVNNVGTLDVRISAGNGQQVSDNATGLLFTAIYNITSSTTGPITIGFQTGCLGTSVPGGVCLAVANGSTTAVPETTQTATFNNVAPFTEPWVAITASPTTVVVNRGAAISVTITATAENGYPPAFGTDLVTFTAVTTNGFAAPGILPPNCATLGTACTATVTPNTATGGTYSITVFGSYVTTDPVSMNSESLVGTVTITVNVQDFSYTGTPSVVNFPTGGSATVPVTVTSLGGFSGTVTITAQCSPASIVTINGVVCGLTALTVATVALPAGGTVSTNLVFTSNSAAGTKDQFVTTATSGTISHKVPATGLFNVLVNDFTFSAGPTSVPVTTGGSGTSTLSLSSLGGTGTLPTCTTTCGFAGPVTITTSTSPASGLAVACPASIALTAGQTGATGTCTFSSVTPGSYTVIITASGGTNGAITHAATVTVAVTGDFTIAANPTSVSVSPIGATGTSIITVTFVSPFTGSVSLASSAFDATSGSPSTGLTCSLSPTSVSATGTSTLSCIANAVGTFRVQVTGTFTSIAGTLSHNVNVTYTVTNVVADFAIAASPTSVTSNVGAAGTSTDTITGSGGFTGVVNLSSNSTSTCTFTPTSVTGSGSSTLSCTFPSAGIFHVTVTGTSTTPALSHSVTVTYTIQDFTISASPTSVTVSPSTAGTSTVTVTALQGFAGVVALTTNSTACSVAPTSVTGSGSATLSCTFTSASTVHVTVTGTSGSLSHGATVTFVVQDFTISASPTAVTVNANVAGTSAISVVALNGFAGVVSLTTNSTSCSVAPTSVTGSGSATLSCTFTSAQLVHVTVTGTSGSLSHSATVTYTVEDFTISAGPSTVNVAAGSAGTSTISIVALQGFASVVNLVSNSTSCVLAPMSVTGSGGSTLSCTFSTSNTIIHVTVTGTSASLSHSTTVTYNVGQPPSFTVSANPTSVTVNINAAGTSSITVTPQNGFTGVVSLTTNSTSCTVSPSSVTTSGSATLSCAFSSAQLVHVTVTGTSGSTTSSATITYTVQDFTISASPTSVNVAAGSPGTSMITVTGLQGFPGVVGLSSNSSSTCTLAPTSVTGSESSTLSCTFSTPNTIIHVTVTGASSNLSHGATVTYNVGGTPDFTITATPSTVSGNANQALTSTITIGALNGFTANIALSADNTACTLSPTSLSTSGTSTLSCTFNSGGAFTVSVTGTSGSLSHSVTVKFNVAQPDFTISASPSTVPITVGQTGTSTITIAPVQGFTGTVSLASSVSPGAGLTCTISPTSVMNSGSSTLSCSATIAGTFTVTVTGTSGSLTHSVPIIFNVSPVGHADFTISANPSILTIEQGEEDGVSTTMSAITLHSLGGFSGNVNLTVTISGNSQNGLRAFLAPRHVMLTANGTARSLLKIFANEHTLVGNYTLTVTGTNGTLSHSVSVTVKVTPGDNPEHELDISVTHGPHGTIIVTFRDDEGTMTFGRIIFRNTHDAHVFLHFLSMIMRVLSNRQVN